MSEQSPFGNPVRQPDPWSDPAGSAPTPPAQSPTVPGAIPPPPAASGAAGSPAGPATLPLTPPSSAAAAGFAADPDATLPLTPAYGAPPARQGTPPTGWAADPGATQPATQSWGAPPPWAAPGAAGWAAGTTPPPGAPGLPGTPGWVPGATPPGGYPYAPDWDPNAGPQVGTAYGTRPPTPPTGSRRGGAAAGGGSGKTPPALIVGAVIGVAAILAVAVWFLLLRPGDNTASATPTPVATIHITPPPTATPEPDATDRPTLTPTPVPTRFRSPTFAGLKIHDAQSLADRSHVTLAVTYEVTDAIAPDTVIAQDPPAGSDVLPGDVIRLTVAAPRPTVAVPDLRGFTEADAVAALLDVGLAVGDRTETWDADTQSGLIISTDPRGGVAVARGTAVDYRVSLGSQPSPSTSPQPTQVPAPELTGMTQDDAQALADELGLVLDIQPQDSLDQDPGSVLSQDPSAGTPLRPGDTLTITVAVRPATVLVPDVRDLAEADAVSLLIEAGLQPGTRSESFDAATVAGLVMRTDPRAGIAVAPGTAVDYVVSLGAQLTPSPAPSAPPAVVPDLVGLTTQDAQTLIDRAGLVMAVSERETLDADPGIVLEQDPLPDTELRTGDTVDAVVSVRPSSIAVPTLRGLPEDQALAALQAAALVPGERTTQYSPRFAAGVVIRSDPAAGTIVALDTAVDYVVSLGAEPTPTPVPTVAPIPAPDLSGLALADVQAFADQNGILLQTVDLETEDAPPGTVMDQDPRAGTPLRPGDTIQVTVARLPADVTVPVLRGMPEDQALAALQAAHLTAGIRTERYQPAVPAGAVVRTDPAAGTSVPRDSAVAYTISLGPEPTPSAAPTPTPVLVPDLGGLTLADARSIADGLGVTLDVRYQPTDSAEPDTILEQQPAPDSALEPGGTIIVTVAQLPPTVTVPDITGQAEPDAIALLTDAGLTPGTRSRRFDPAVPQGAVISSDPAAGAVVDRGTPVAYVLSRGPQPTPSPTPTPTPITIPSLVGGTLADAQRFADDNGLRLDATRQETPDAPPDTILDQDPTEGARLRPGGTLHVTVAAAPTTAAVPDVRGQAEADAVAAILDAGLATGRRTERFNASVSQGAVIRTQPVAGTVVPLGSPVDYVVSRGPEPTPTPSPTPAPTPVRVDIPDLVGSDVGAARAFADANGLTLDVVPQETLDAPQGTILEQDPRPGSQLTAGETLRVIEAVPPALVTVPDLRGMSEADGVAALTDARLVPGRRIDRFNDTVPADAIIRTDPIAGTQSAPGTSVDYVISKGPQPTPAPIPAPDLRGLSRADAQATADAAGLVLDITELVTDAAAPDTVLDQDPAPGTGLAAGDTVHVTVAIAPQLVTVPTLHGLSEADGISALTDAGLTPGRRIDRYNDTVPAGAIVRTDPPADQQVPAGTTVDYVVSRGPEPVPAPMFVGLTIEQAQALAVTNGLTLDVTEVDSDTAPTGTVLDQDPAAGDPLTGGPIKVSVARNTAQVTVPDLRGMSEADGVAALTDAGLVPGRRIDRFNPNIPVETIVRSDPAAGTLVPPGTSVDYVVSKGPEPVPVPDVQGLLVDDAQGVANSSGLSLDVSYQDTRDAPPDTVISQDPPAGSAADGSGTIRVVVARAPRTVQVPRLRDVAEADAVAMLLDAGLQPGQRSERHNAEVAVGSVLGTDPHGGVEVEPGSTVDYTISTGPAPVNSTPEPTGEPTAEPTVPPTAGPGGGGLDDPAVVAALDGVVGQVPALRELDQLEAIPYTPLTPKQLRRQLRDDYDAANPPEVVAAEQATLIRLGLLPPDADLRQMTLDLLESQVVALYDPLAGELGIVTRDGATDAALRFFAAGEVDKALVDQHVDLSTLAVSDPTQTDRAIARAALPGGDAAVVMIDWAGQNLSADEQAGLPGLTPVDQGLLGSMPLYVRKLFTFPTDAGTAFIQAIRANGGWAAVNAVYDKLPASTEQILHPEKYRLDKPVALALPDVASVLGDGWSLSDERTLGELGIGIWVDDGADGSPNAWAADGWGGDHLVSLDGPDGAWAVVWQTAWDTDTDADEFTSAADAAMADLPGAHVVLRGADLTGSAPSPSLVIVASDQGVLDTLMSGLGLGG